MQSLYSAFPQGKAGENLLIFPPVAQQKRPILAISRTRAYELLMLRRFKQENVGLQCSCGCSVVKARSIWRSVKGELACNACWVASQDHPTHKSVSGVAA